MVNNDEMMENEVEETEVYEGEVEGDVETSDDSTGIKLAVGVGIAIGALGVIAGKYAIKGAKKIGGKVIRKIFKKKVTDETKKPIDALESESDNHSEEDGETKEE